MFLKKLKEYENVGHKICNRPRNNWVLKQMFLQLTIFQLIAAEILELITDKNDRKARLSIKLSRDNYEPVYLLDKKWEKISIVVNKF